MSTFDNLWSREDYERALAKERSKQYVFSWEGVFQRREQEIEWADKYVENEGDDQ